MMNYELIKNLYGIDELKGCPAEELDFLRAKYCALPKELASFLETAGETKELLCVQDEWLFPAKHRKYAWLDEGVYKDCFVLLNENQGVYQAVIKRVDMAADNPPVYVTDGTKFVGLCADRLTDFFMGMLVYQSVFAMEYSAEDFFWYTDEEMGVIRKAMGALPYRVRNWYSDTIDFYSNAKDNVLFVMSDGNQGTYGAMTKSSYSAIEAVLRGLGEA